MHVKTNLIKYLNKGNNNNKGNKGIWNECLKIAAD